MLMAGRHPKIRGKIWHGHWD